MKRRPLFLWGIMLVGITAALLLSDGVHAECSERNQEACNDQSQYAQLLAVTEFLWAWARMLLLLSRLLEILREHVLFVAQDVLAALLPMLYPWLLLLILVAVITVVITHFLSPIMTLRLTDLRTNAAYVAAALLVLSLGGPALVFLEESRIGLVGWMTDLVSPLSQTLAESWGLDTIENDPLFFLDGDTVPPLYKEALCPPPAAIAAVDTGSWDLSRNDPDQRFISDTASWFLLSKYDDIWCASDLENRPILPKMFAGTATVEGPVRATEAFPYPDTAGGPFSIVGPPTVSRQTVQEVVCQPRHGGIPPSCPFVPQIYDVLIQAGFDPAFWLVFAAKETEFGSTGPGRPPDYNLHNLRCNSWDGGGCNRNYAGGFSRYDNYMHSVQAWTELMCCRNVYVDRGRVTPEDIIPIYAPAFENDTALYIAQVKSWITNWRNKDAGRVNNQAVVPPPPEPTPDDPTVFPGYFPYQKIDHLQAARRQIVLGAAVTGMSRMWMGGLIGALALLEQLMHLLFTIALVATWIALMFATLLTPFLPTRQAFSTVLRMVITVLKAAWMSTIWVAVVMMLLELGKHHPLLLIGNTLLGELIIGWQVVTAALVLVRGIGMDLGRIVVRFARTAVAAAVGDVGGAMRSFAQSTGGSMNERKPS